MPTVRYGSPRDKQYRRAIDAWHENRLATNLLLEPGQDRIYAGNGQVPDYEWPNPNAQGRATVLLAQRQRAAATVTENLQPDVFYVGSDRILRDPGQVLGYDWQTDLPPRTDPNRRALIDLARRSDQDVDETSGIYIGQDRVYAGPGQVASYSWQMDVPKGYPRSIALRTEIDSEVTWNLVGQDAIYGASGQAAVYDLSPPPRGYARAVSLRGFTDEHLNNTLVGQDVLYGAPGLVVAWDWPVPRGYPRASTLRGFVDQHLQDTLSVVPPTFYGAAGQAITYDWQLALPTRIRAAAIDLRSMLNQGLPRTLTAQDVFFGAPGQTPVWDWPTTRMPPRRGQPTHDAVTVEFLNLLPPVADPVRSYDLSQPVVLRARIRQADQHGTDLPQIGDPLRPIDTPLSVRLPARIRQAEGRGFDVVLLIGADRIYGIPGQVPSYLMQTALPPRGYTSRIRQDWQQWAMIDNYPLVVVAATRIIARLLGLDEPVKRRGGIDETTQRTEGLDEGTNRRRGLDE